MRFEIEKSIFDYFYGMKIVVVVADDIPQISNTTKIKAALDDAWKVAAAAAASVEYGNPQSHPYIKPWGEHMKKVGASRKHFH